MDSYDEVISFLGEWGPYQRSVFLSISIIIIPNGYLALSMVFLADTPPHRCQLSNSSADETFLGNLSLPLPTEEVGGQQVYSRCSRYRAGQDLGSNGSTLVTERCLDGWVYSTDRYVSTIVTQVGQVKSILFL